MARTEREKLVRLGLRSPSASGSVVNSLIETLKNNIAEKWKTFQEKLEDVSLGSWSDFETWLENNGVTASRAKSIRNQLETKYSSWSDFKDKILNTYTSWDDFRSAFNSTTDFESNLKTESGVAVAGIRVFEESGTTKNGVEIPKGGTEIWGKEIHFSESPAKGQTIQPDKDNDDSVGSLENPIEYSDTTLKDTNVDKSTSPPTVKADGDVITFECTITNNTNYNRTIQVDRIVDGEVLFSFETQLDANGGTQVAQQFDVEGEPPLDVGIHDFTFNKAKPKTIEVVPPDV